MINNDTTHETVARAAEKHGIELSVQTMREAFQSWSEFATSVRLRRFRVLTRRLTVGGTGHNRVDHEPPGVVAVDPDWYHEIVNDREHNHGTPAPVTREEASAKARLNIRDLSEDVARRGAAADKPGSTGGGIHVVITRGRHQTERTVLESDGNVRRAYPGKPLVVLVDIFWMAHVLNVSVDDLRDYAYARRKTG